MIFEKRENCLFTFIRQNKKEEKKTKEEETNGLL